MNLVPQSRFFNSLVRFKSKWRAFSIGNAFVTASSWPEAPELNVEREKSEAVSVVSIALENDLFEFIKCELLDNSLIILSP